MSRGVFPLARVWGCPPEIHLRAGGWEKVRLLRSTRNDDEGVSLVTSLAMPSERVPHNDGRLSPIYLNEIGSLTRA